MEKESKREIFWKRERYAMHKGHNLFKYWGIKQLLNKLKHYVLSVYQRNHQFHKIQGKTFYLDFNKIG